MEISVTMQLRRDERGRPVGLDWPKAPEFTQEQVKKSYRKPGNTDNLNRDGRPKKSHCSSGLHEFPKHWRPNKTGGGGYCVTCKRERARAWRAKNRDKVAQHQRNHRAKVKANAERVT